MNLAAAYGVPVRFLQEVLSYTDIEAVSGGSQTGENTFSDGITMELNEDSVLKALNSTADSDAVNTLYHESTHAYMLWNNTRGATWWKGVAEHYRGAKLQNGRTVNDTSLAAFEAAGTYAGHRAGTTWSAVKQLILVKDYLDQADSGARKLAEVAAGFKKLGLPDEIPRKFNAGMKQRVFGYNFVDGKQSEVVGRSIPHTLKWFLDVDVLEFKIHDSFSQMHSLVHMYDGLVARISRLPK